MKRFGTDGIRGRWGSDELNSDIARALAAVLAQEFSGPIPIVRDTRASGPEVLAALAEGLGSRGIDYGVLPTPALSAILAATPAEVGIAVTASHNPWHDNGLKVLGGDGGKLSPDQEATIDLLLGEAFGADRSQEPLQKSESGAEIYLTAQQACLEGVRCLAGQKIAVDAANGAGGLSSRRLLASLGVDAIFLGDTPNGMNINAGVGALHPEELQRVVVEQGCAARIALDGDADRCTLVNHRGEVVHGDALLLLLAQPPGLVGTVMCNSALEEALSAGGIAFHRSPVGDRNVQMAMQSEGWRVGGEPSGHVLMTDALPTGDGLITGLRSLSGGANLENRLQGFAPYPDAQVAVPVPSKPPLEELMQVQALLREAADTLKGRVLLRYSGTEPKLRILVEAADGEEAEGWCVRLEEAVRAEFSR